MTSTPNGSRQQARKPQDRQPVKKPRTVTVGIYADNQLGQDWDRATDALREATEELASSVEKRVARALQLDPDLTYGPALDKVDSDDEATLGPLREAVAAAEAALDEATIWFTFRGIGARRMQELAKQYPPTDEDLAEHERLGGVTRLEYSPDGFHQALLAVSCVAPAGYDWEQVWNGDAWNNAEIEALVAHAINANQAVRTATHRPAPRWTG
jgi:hypothetical protein